MNKKLLILVTLVSASCAKGPLTQVSQSRHSGGFLASMSDRVVQDSQLVTDGERFYFGTRQGTVFCVRAKNHGHIWAKKLSGSIDTSVLVDGNRAYVGTGDGKIYSLDRNTGKIIWNIQLTSPPRGVMTKIGNIVTVGINEGTLVALDQDNGNVVWKYHHEPYEKMKIQFMVQGSVEQDRLFIGFPNGQLVALDAKTGTEIWKRMVMNQDDRFYDLASILLVPQKGIIATLVSGPSIFFTFDGRDLWTYKDASTQAAPLLLNDQILLATKDKLVWLGLDGIEKKSIPYDHPMRPSGIAHDQDYTYVSSLEGGLFVIDEKSSKQLWEYQMGISVQGAPILLNNKIWVLNRRGQLIAMRRR
jgi:outer membrane protein assembly factor BamB